MCHRYENPFCHEIRQANQIERAWKKSNSCFHRMITNYYNRKLKLDGNQQSNSTRDRCRYPYLKMTFCFSFFSKFIWLRVLVDEKPRRFFFFSFPSPKFADISSPYFKSIMIAVLVFCHCHSSRPKHISNWKFRDKISDIDLRISSQLFKSYNNEIIPIKMSEKVNIRSRIIPRYIAENFEIHIGKVRCN